MPEGERKMRPSKVLCLLAMIFAVILTVTLNPGISHSATRGETVDTVIRALGLPLWGGGKHFTDLPPDHPFAASIETAAALGILHPSEQFYPDIDATRAEALMFSLQAMGLRHEASLMGYFDKGAWPLMPSYIAPYLSLASEMEPSPPGQFLDDPAGSLSPADLRSLGMWLRNCRQHMEWRKEIKGERSVLVLSRNNVGTPPSEWGVQSVEFGSEDEARTACDRLRAMGFSALVHALEWTWVVRIGPFPHYLEAWETMMKIPSPEMTVVPFSQNTSHALFVAALAFDPAETPPRIVTAASVSGRRLPINIIAENSGAEGAINGGFFSGGRIIGSLVINSRPLSGPYGDRSAAGWNLDGTGITFGRGDFRSTITLGKKTLPLSAMNSVPPQGGIAIFTPDVWGYVTGAPPDGLEITVKNGTVAGVRPSAVSNHFVTREGFLVIARGYPARELQGVPDGTPVSIGTEWAEPAFHGLDFILQAGPMLLREGKAQNSAEGFGPRTLSVPHPRSILGWDGSKVWFIVIDGRDPWHRAGTTIAETAALIRRMGLTDALNLDGGGSSSIWWMGKTVTSPPGGVSRPVPYALVF